MTGAPPPLLGRDYRVEFEPAPGGLEGAILFRTHGRYTGQVLVEIYAALLPLAQGQELNILADTRFSENYVDYTGYFEVARMVTAQGIRLLNIAVCDTDPGRRFVVRFGDEVSRLAGLEVRSRVEKTLPDAVAALAALMAETGTPQAQQGLDGEGV